ncbi:MAG: flavodoxin domain-containing protein [Pseudomonadota bacterium]
MRIDFLHGTETGTAEIVCEDLNDAVAGQVETTIASLEDVDPSELSGDTLYIVVCSTFGSGDLPSTAEPFMQKLEKTMPDLKHVRFALFGLGDRTFGETFNQGSETLMTALLARGAQMVGDRGIADASSADMPEEIAIPWLQDILQKASAQA